MAADTVKAILKAEAEARAREEKAALQVKKMIEEAHKQSENIKEAAKRQAESQAHIILSDARYSADGVIKQAEKLAELREKKSIADTEKQYEIAIEMVFEEILN